MNFRRVLLSLSIFLLFVAHAYAQQAPTATAAGATPALRLKALDGKTYDIAEMRGQVVLASFGATWCAPCRTELAALEEIKREYTQKPVRFMWVSIESSEEISNAVLRHRAKEMKLTMPVLRDESVQVFSQFSARKRLPMVVIFDAEGKLSAPPMFGMSDAETYKIRVREKLDAALKRTTPTADTVKVSLVTTANR